MIFIVELGSIVVSVIFVIDAVRNDPGQEALWFTGSIAVWLWLTVLFANFAEAMAEGRGKAQAKALRATRTTTIAHRQQPSGGVEEVPAPELRPGDLVVVAAGEVIPADGEIVEGVGSVDESAITGESAPVIREAGGDRSGVTGGTRLLSDRLVIEVTQEPGHSFLDRMIALVEGAERRKTPNEVALNILLAGLTITFLAAVVTLYPFALYAGTVISMPVLVALLVALIPTTIGGLLSAIGIAGMDRLVRRNVLAMSGRAVEAAGDVDVLLLDKTGTITLGNRQASELVPADGVEQHELADTAQLASLADETPEGRSIVVLAKQHGIRERTLAEVEARVHPLHGLDTHERRRPGRSSDPQGRARRDQGIRRVERRPGACRARGRRPADRRGRRHAAARRPGQLGAGRGAPEGHRQGRHGGALRRAPADGHPLDHDHRRQPGHRRRHRPRGRRGRLPRRGHAGGKMELIKDEQTKGRLVAMTGDGTNDAPALAQSDVGVAMNTGTQAAKEAGNMVDLDSNPTKLIEIVEVAKQQLITRGALTTFSIANDVAKYFAIIPAIFVATYAVGGGSGPLESLNVMDLGSPQSAILSAIIFNALVIPALVPLALHGVRYRAIGATALLRRNLLIYGLGGVILPFIGIKLIDLVVHNLLGA